MAKLFNQSADLNLHDLVLGMEQKFAENKEATFQIKHISESVSIDLKKMIRSLS